MKHLVIFIVPAVSIALVSGLFVLNLRADSTPTDTLQTYQGHHFTLQLPADLTQTADVFEREELTLEYANTDGSLRLLILSTPFSEPLTSRFVQDQYPSNVIDELGLLSVGGEPAFTFFKSDDYSGGTFEVWFVRDGLIHEVITTAEHATWLKSVLSTWHFR